MKNHIDGKAFIVTGGSSGLGKETARLLLEHGARVIITGRNPEKLERAQAELGEAMAVRADATSVEDWRALLTVCKGEFGGLDILVNNHGAGIRLAEIENADDADIDTAIDINLSSCIKGSREAIRLMKPAGKGLIVNVSSVCATRSWPTFGMYAAAKAGLVAFTRCLSMEMAQWGGRATSFIPGAFTTGFASALGLDNQEMIDKGFPDGPDFAEALLHCINIPENSFVEQSIVWGTAQVREFPFL